MHLGTQDKVSARHASWIAYLQQFTFVIKHKAGALNKIADALSRHQTLLTEMPGFDRLCDLYATDPYFSHVVQKLQEGVQSEFTWVDGFLFHGNQLCVPEGSLRLKIIQELHNVGHVGRDRTLQLVVASYFWPSLCKDVNKFVERCRFVTWLRAKRPMWACICSYLSQPSLGQM
ncbi:uncharacterized protein LOC111382860 [Olea europaea var. sylvestris]|uniref:uncharacterized protein LOC111382860 n=1 Tax=Olea europaea var. sylvestris TaxID=158386 RepID=UPI000C1CD822|nr:uncharacterized protein LOC111382860 [Olea europaea var. sylvestris]